MSVKIRLARCGAKKKPFYRIVAANCTAPRDGRFLEKLGTYAPMFSKDHPQRITIKNDRLEYWFNNGAKPTDTVLRLLQLIDTNITMPKFIQKQVALSHKRIAIKKQNKKMADDVKEQTEQAQ